MTDTATQAQAQNTVEVDAVTVDDAKQVFESFATVGDLMQEAQIAACMLYAEQDSNKRRETIAAMSKIQLNALVTTAALHLEAKVNPNSEQLQSLPDIIADDIRLLVQKIDRVDILDVTRIAFRFTARMTEEQLSSYEDLGPLYAGVPMGVDFGLEVGIRTGEGETLKRSGIVLGLRLDHATGAKPNASLGFPKTKD